MRYCFLVLILLFISNIASFGSDDIFLKKSIEEMPLKVIESSIGSTLPMVVYISGDGGLSSFSDSLCYYFSKNGFPVVVLNARKYFWGRKTPEETATDLVTIIEAYGTRWKRDKFILTGFSFG
ncbi:MAG: AcvB/VirJ family lysyl-phosphatidylglycerol hydrolase, partial [Bacteroidota bacterium]